MSSLEKSIIATIAYFDIFDYPLTLMEIWQWLYGFGSGQEASLAEVEQALAGLADIERFSGFYFLSGRQAIVKTRLSRHNIAEDKFLVAKLAVKILSKLPFVRLVAVCNTLGYGNSRAESDIDLFIITTKNRLWTARLFSVFLFQFMGWRPTKEKQANRICLSFFVSEDGLDLSRAILGKNDVYFHFWLATLMPLYDQGGYYHRLMVANEWVKGYVPNIQEPVLNRKRMVKPTYSLFKKIMEIHTNWLENFYAYMQFKFMGKQLKKMINRDTRVIVNNKMLKFHPVDRRGEYEEVWRRKLASLLS